MAYPLELQAEQQDEGACGADAHGHAAVGEAALEELPSLVVVKVREFWPVPDLACLARERPPPDY